MAIQQALFYTFSVLTIVSAIFLLLTKNIVHAAFSFLAILLGVAILFVFANAEFIAVAQLMIYVGGVLVLLLFGVMLTSAYSIKEKPILSYQSIFIYFICMIFGGIMIYAIRLIIFDVPIYGTNIIVENFSLPQKIGYYLMTDFIVPFEASGILLMVALIGAATIAGRK